MTLLQAALNGDRRHPAVPKTPDAIARDAQASAKAGADVVHVHAYDDAGAETLDATACAAFVRAIRAICPDLPISLTTSATIISDPAQRLRAVRAWTELPDLVTANQGEEGIEELCEFFISHGVGIEAGLLSPSDAKKFAASSLKSRCHRVLIEPLNPDPVVALREAAEMEAIVLAAGCTLPQVHHGYDGSCWAVNERGLARGHGIRTGLEDVLTLPDGRAAVGNVELVVAARRLIEEAARR